MIQLMTKREPPKFAEDQSRLDANQPPQQPIPITMRNGAR